MGKKKIKFLKFDGKNSPGSSNKPETPKTVNRKEEKVNKADKAKPTFKETEPAAAAAIEIPEDVLNKSWDADNATDVSEGNVQIVQNQQVKMNRNISCDTRPNPWSSKGSELNADAPTFAPSTNSQHTKEDLKDEDEALANLNQSKKQDKPFNKQNERTSVNDWRNNDYRNKERTVSKNRDDEKKQSRMVDYYNWKSERADPELDAFLKEERSSKRVDFKKVFEIEGDLFAMPKEYSLGHCVAEDMRMGSGIAVSFKREFKAVDVLLNQRARQGGLAVLEAEHEGGKRFIYYMVTKRTSTGKPTYDTFWSSLQKMRDHVRDNEVRQLAVPRLGCGLDRLEWDKVKHMMEFAFADVDIQVTVCNFQQGEEPQKQYLTTKLTNVQKHVADIESWTLILYFTDEQGTISDEMQRLEEKFNFLSKFKRESKSLGVPVKSVARQHELYGCVVKKRNQDPFDFVALQKCASFVNRGNMNRKREERYEYVAFQAFKDQDDLINEKVITVLRNSLSNVDIHVCWHGDLVDKMPYSAY